MMKSCRLTASSVVVVIIWQLEILLDFMTATSLLSKIAIVSMLIVPRSFYVVGAPRADSLVSRSDRDIDKLADNSSDQYPRHVIVNYIVPDDDHTGPDYSHFPAWYSHLPCGVVELQDKNGLIPSELWHTYQSCVPITPKASTS